MSSSHHNTANILSQSFEHYFDAVGAKAMQRAGNNPQLKGIVHEQMFCDKLNMQPENLFFGKVARMTRNPQAHDVDVVQLDADGRCTGRFQLKDTTSESGVRDTLGRIRKGQYRSTKLVGTEETAAKYNKMRSAGDKSMQSSGISSTRTGRIADNTGVRSMDKQQFLHNMQDVGVCAVNSAEMGAVFSALNASCNNIQRYRNGEVDGIEAVGKVLAETGKGAASAGVTTAGALTLKEGGKALGSTLGSETLRKVAGSNVGTAVAFGAVEVLGDTVKLARGEISSGEYGKSVATTAGRAAGGYGGASMGATFGTAILPGVGTGIGSLGGAVVGGMAGQQIVETVCDNSDGVIDTVSEVLVDFGDGIAGGMDRFGETVSDVCDSITSFIDDLIY